MQVPFLDLKAQYKEIRDEIAFALQRVLDNTAFAGGPFVEDFEKRFAAYCGTKEAIGVGSGTDALWLALLAAGVGPGDEVITVPNTFIATAEAISVCGATPVFVDVDRDTCTLSPQALEAAITERTRAIIPVHLYGQMADMDPILEIAASRNLFVIEDACQAHGAEYRGRRAGAMGLAGCFSFYPGKNLGAYGEAGGVVTNDEELASRIRELRDHGQERKYMHRRVGWNARMDGFQGAVLGVKLKYLDAWNDRRRLNARRYAEELAGLSLALPVEAAYAKHIYHVYCVRVRDRDRVMDALRERGVHCGIHYPVPVHLQEAYRDLGLTRGTCPVAESMAGEILSLPMYPELADAQLRAVADALREVLVPEGAAVESPAGLGEAVAPAAV